VPLIRSTLMMSIPSSVVPGGGDSPAAVAALGSSRDSAIRTVPYSTVTDFARLRGWSTSVPRASATW
jgi:hypothetical protein